MLGRKETLNMNFCGISQHSFIHSFISFIFSSTWDTFISLSCFSFHLGCNFVSVLESLQNSTQPHEGAARPLKGEHYIKGTCPLVDSGWHHGKT